MLVLPDDSDHEQRSKEETLKGEGTLFHCKNDIRKKEEINV